MNICMVSDFFYPNMGGVENHLFCLSQCLLKRGHKVIIVTHAYGDRKGIRWLSSGLKVYYLPVLVMYNECTLPTMAGNLLAFRDIWLREGIQVVHGHQAFSSLAHEAIFHAASMGLATIFTDHSLFGFSDASSILTNKLLKGTLANVNSVICVSHTSKENTVLRAAIQPERVFVIPNAVVAEQFQPGELQVRDHKINIIVACRLVYRKGIDLLVAVIPRICKQYPDVNFVIAGDGPKRVDLEQMREKHFLMDRVEFTGALPSHEVRNVLVRGQIFLNTSLTEAFCMAIVEAASCGLLVVSTRVGGVPEVLPSDMILLAQPDEDHLLDSLHSAIETVRQGKISAQDFHTRVTSMYSWHSVAQRTELVYQQSLAAGRHTLLDLVDGYYLAGPVYGKILCILAALEHLLLIILDRVFPPTSIEPAPQYTRNCK